MITNREERRSTVARALAGLDDTQVYALVSSTAGELRELVGADWERRRAARQGVSTTVGVSRTADPLQQ